jgi:hypothetical protein
VHQQQLLAQQRGDVYVGRQCEARPIADEAEMLRQRGGAGHEGDRAISARHGIARPRLQTRGFGAMQPHTLAGLQLQARPLHCARIQPVGLRPHAARGQRRRHLGVARLEVIGARRGGQQAQGQQRIERGTGRHRSSPVVFSEIVAKLHTSEKPLWILYGGGRYARQTQ